MSAISPEVNAAAAPAQVAAPVSETAPVAAAPATSAVPQNSQADVLRAPTTLQTAPVPTTSDAVVAPVAPVVPSVPPTRAETAEEQLDAKTLAKIEAKEGKQDKLYSTLLAGEQKRKDAEMATVCSEVKNAGKLVTKAAEAESQAVKRQHKAIELEHATNKKLLRAQAAHDKALLELEELNKELDIKKSHKSKADAFWEEKKQLLEQMRAEKPLLDREREVSRIPTVRR